MHTNAFASQLYFEGSCVSLACFSDSRNELNMHTRWKISHGGFDIHFAETFTPPQPQTPPKIFIFIFPAEPFHELGSGPAGHVAPAGLLVSSQLVSLPYLYVFVYVFVK